MAVSRRTLIYFITFCLVCSFHFICGLDPSDVLFVIVSQSNQYHAYRAKELQKDILEQVLTWKKGIPQIRLVHEEFPHVGAWTIIPLMPWIIKLNGLWVLFIEERTKVNVPKLLMALENYDPKEAIWMGRGLYDRESTIIHHFAFSENPREFKYPLFASGFVMSMNLLKRLVKRNKNKTLKTDFSIDAAHELALYVGKPLLNLPDLFCVNYNKKCATHPVDITDCGKPVQKEEIFFAVKTCYKYHVDRISVVKKTWGKEAKHIEFFSHYQDESIPTTDVGIENTERGHCAKTFTIFKLTLERAKHLPIRWLLLADDDTLLNVQRLQEVLRCWNSSEPIAIGERYGFNVQDANEGGYNYLTGGGGIALSIIALPFILQHCSCHQIDAPDDMYLGICLARLNIPIVHLPDFHQARPNDYASDYLAVQKPVSFHKHWMIDPLHVYKKWLAPVEREQHNHFEL